jgi:serine/threonine-protein kinase HipA
MRQVIDEIHRDAKTAPDRALTEMPTDFHAEAHEAIKAILPGRLKLLETAYDKL